MVCAAAAVQIRHWVPNKKSLPTRSWQAFFSSPKRWLLKRNVVIHVIKTRGSARCLRYGGRCGPGGGGCRALLLHRRWRGAARGLVVAATALVAIAIVVPATLAAHALTATQHLHLVGADFGAVFLHASLVSRMAPAPVRGAALGSYNTLQSLGLFAGGALGGALVKWAGAPGLFATTAVLTALWLVLTWPLQPVGRNAGGGH